MSALPSTSVATSSNTGAIILQGPHHGAQKSTSFTPSNCFFKFCIICFNNCHLICLQILLFFYYNSFYYIEKYYAYTYWNTVKYNIPDINIIIAKAINTFASLYISKLSILNTYFIVTIVTPNPPSFGIPCLNDFTLLCRLNVFSTASFKAPVPLP